MHVLHTLQLINTSLHLSTSAFQAVVSLRDVAAMLNQTCQKSQRAEAQRLLALSRWQDVPGTVAGHICFQEELCFVRPEYYKARRKSILRYDI